MFYIFLIGKSLGVSGPSPDLSSNFIDHSVGVTGIFSTPYDLNIIQNKAKQNKRKNPLCLCFIKSVISFSLLQYIFPPSVRTKFPSLFLFCFI